MNATDDGGESVGDSAVQRSAEAIMVEGLAVELGVALRPTVVRFDGRRVEIDAADDERTVLVEAWAHQGPPRGAQRNKVLSDALKLTWVREKLDSRPRLILLLSDESAARPFVSERTWYSAALSDLGVEVHVVEIPAEVRAEITAAQLRQFR